MLDEAGFDVERGAYGLATAVRARVGSGPLSIVICAEYDALPGGRPRLRPQPHRRRRRRRRGWPWPAWPTTSA